MDLSRGTRHVVTVVAILAALFSVGLIAQAMLPTPRASKDSSRGAAGGAGGAATLPPQDVPARGSGQFIAARGANPPVGSGRVYRYEVLVEQGSPVSVVEFARTVDQILSDRRGWAASGRWGFQRVPAGPSDFTVYLATPGTTDDLCARSGVGDTLGEVSCRGGRNVVINLRRWQLAVPWYAGAIEEYRQMVLNHEVGHYLGHSHVGCPGAGQLAPVMLQQSLGLQSCVRNPWPYPDGKTFVTGPAGTP